MRGDARYDINKSHQTLEKYLKKRKFKADSVDVYVPLQRVITEDELKTLHNDGKPLLESVEPPDAFHRALHPPYGGDCK